MFNKFAKYTLADREFHLVFSLAAMQQVINKYGSVQALTEIQETEDIGESMEMVSWLFATLANQGEWIMNGGKQPADLITPEWAAMFIMPGEIKAVMSACNEAMILGMGTEHKRGENEVVDVVLEELESEQKNLKGAE